jgi:hypothetical protein
MKRIKLFLSGIIFSVNVFAQYSAITFEKSETPNLKLLQIDFMNKSTLFHFQFINSEGFNKLCTNENIYINDIRSTKSYKLLNSINLPFCDKVHLLDDTNQKVNFTLEFEKLPKDLTKFDIIDDYQRRFTFYGVNIDTSQKSDITLNLESFYGETPVKEYGYFYKDGNRAYYFKHNGLLVAAILTKNHDYGNFNQIYLLIQNFTGRDINIIPEDLSAKYLYVGRNLKRFNSEIDDLYYDSQSDSRYTKNIKRVNDTLFQQDIPILTFEEYLKKVKKAQAWENFAKSFSESLAAAFAGYSSININSSIYEYGTAYESVTGNIGNSSININGRSSSYGNSYGSTSIQIYNAGATYFASQNAERNIMEYRKQQNEILSTLSEGYLQLNTIKNSTEYLGFINLPYNDADIVHLDVPIKGIVYKFSWNK